MTGKFLKAFGLKEKLEIHTQSFEKRQGMLSSLLFRGFLSEAADTPAHARQVNRAVNRTPGTQHHDLLRETEKPTRSPLLSACF